MAVYTEISGEDLDAFLDHYDIGPLLSCKGIAEGVENSNYLLMTDGVPYILTLYEKRVAAEELPFYLGLMRHLAEKSLPSALPIAGTDGRTLRTLAHKPAALIAFLNGMSPRRVTRAHCIAAGELAARLHVAAGDYPAAVVNHLSLDGWRRLAGLTSVRADTVLPGLAAAIRAELDHLAIHWPDGLPRGIIHADLFPDNVLFQGETVTGIIDFYFACTDQFAYELAIMLNCWCFEPNGEFNATKARALIAAYDDVRPLSPPEIAALPVLARGAALRFLLTRLHDWLNPAPGALVRPKDPLEYYRKLTFHQSTASPAEYGLFE